MQEAFRKILIDTGYIHFPLPLSKENTVERELAEKKVTRRQTIWNGEENLPSFTGIGKMEMIPLAGRSRGNVIRVTGPTSRADKKYEDSEENGGKYHTRILFETEGENWEIYNRISFWVRPDCKGGHNIHFNVRIKNEGKEPVPDIYKREGVHFVNLINHEWNQVIWEFNELPRNCVTSFWVTMDTDGQDTSTGREYQFDFESFELQTCEHAEMERGWICDSGRISYSMSGYYTYGNKTAVANTGADSFSLLSEDGKVVLHKETVHRLDRFGKYELLDFSEVEESGFYRLQSGNTITEVFEIGKKVMESAIWKAVNFIFCERCGFPVPGKHGRCHMDVTAEYNGLILSCGGGWHDAGDMSQQMLQTAEVAQEILELAGRVEDDPLLRHRLLEEGLWGLEFTLRSRFGDGYRASSVGLGLWTDGLIGNMDDVKYRVHNQAYQNFFCSAAEAQAALILQESDPDLAWKCADAAKEDFWFAQRRFLEKGMEKPIMWEHTYQSGLSQYYAAAAWAAASVCRYEYDETLAGFAKEYGAKLLKCQETGDADVPMKGFFYRDESHKVIVHFAHQGRDHSFVQALAELCQAFPDAAERKDWEEGMRLYGGYLKELYKMASPYGMLPAGLYHISEAEDAETFELLHLQVKHEEEKVNYEAQLKEGIDLGGGYYIRMFPVWFSFRGNAAIMLGMGKAAAIIGSYFKEESLKEIARQQLYWMSGKNPFCQSLIYGEGTRYAQQYTHFPGEMMGEMPVGIQTRKNEDIPYWPAGNNATYKEVWLTTAGRWLSIIAELYPES